MTWQPRLMQKGEQWSEARHDVIHHEWKLIICKLNITLKYIIYCVCGQNIYSDYDNSKILRFTIWMMYSCLETRIHHSNGIELFSLYFWRQETFMNKEKKLCVDLNGQKIQKIKNVFCRCVISVHLAENGFKLIYSDMFRRRI